MKAKTMVLTEVSSSKCFGGYQKVFSHESRVNNCPMAFAIYLPESSKVRKLPVIYFLSGYTSNEQTFANRAGAQRYAAEHNVIIVCPDTSPRVEILGSHLEIAGVGWGSGWYVNATEEPWKKHYQMFDYVTDELIQVINENFPTIPGCMSLIGHSMGGHGALNCAIKKPELYKFVSVFAPVAHTTKCWLSVSGFGAYLGPNESAWKQWDATLLIGQEEATKKIRQCKLEILVDQGSNDEYKDALHVDDFIAACKQAKFPVTFIERKGYDHEWCYLSTFIGEHIQEHAKRLYKDL